MTAYDLQCFVLFRLASTWHIKLINLASRAALRPHDISALHIWQCNCATVQQCSSATVPHTYLSIWTPGRAGPPRFGPSAAMETGSACREPGAVHCVGNATTRTNGNRRRTGCPTIAAPAIFPIPQRHCVAERSSCCCSACCTRGEKKRGRGEWLNVCTIKWMHLGVGHRNYERRYFLCDILTVFPAPTIPWRRARPCRWSGYCPAVDSATTVHPWRPGDPPLWWHCARYPCRGSQEDRQRE